MICGERKQRKTETGGSGQDKLERASTDTDLWGKSITTIIIAIIKWLEKSPKTVIKTVKGIKKKMREKCRAF